VADLLQVRFPSSDQARTLELRSLATGALVQNVDATGIEATTLSVQYLPSGAYLVLLRAQDGLIDQQKIIVQH
jgi:hypothetical protein